MAAKMKADKRFHQMVQQKKKTRSMPNTFILLLITVFQVITFSQVIFEDDGTFKTTTTLLLASYILIEWVYYILFRAITKRKNFEVEFIAFFLSAISLVIVASVYPADLIKQYITVLLGIAIFIFMVWFMQDLRRINFIRIPLAILAVGLLGVNLLIAEVTNGAKNWISVFGISIQPSELVKVAFIFVGAATLERLQSTRSLVKFMIFSFAIIGGLFIMRDFGTALIFFFTFLVLAFMRSGDIRTLFLVVGGAGLGGGLVLTFMPYVKNRFSTYRHVWEHMDAGGYQQTRVLIYSVSGGLLGVGIGNGKLKDVFASTTDLVFGVLCEEWGILLAMFVVITYAILVIYAIHSAQKARSSFYAISACAAAGLLLFQACLNIFGVTDLLPLTGVTLPFVSQGGTSMIACWGLVAFIKACDLRTYQKTYDALEGDFR